MTGLGELFKEEKIISEEVGILEDRLFMVFSVCELVWLPFIAVVSLAVGLYFTAGVVAGMVVFILLLALLQKLTNKLSLIKWIYLFFTLIKIPVLWYIVGGNASSAGALFLLEIIFFAMVNKGLKQIVFVALSMLTSSMVSSLSGRFPERFTGLAMNGQQHLIMSAAMGSSITIFIAFLIVYQKREFNRENRIAKETDEQLKMSNQMQKNFLANMSHEIRSPLGIVLGFNDLISETDDMDKIKEYSANITHAGKTLQTVINDILDYSKIEAGKLDIIENDYRLSVLIKELEKDIQLRCNEKGLIFNVIYDDKLPDILYGDNIRIKQCVFNILTNAVKYTSDGSVTFTISFGGKDDDGFNEIIFSVKDTGKGIGEELIPKLFTSFQRLNEGQNRGIEGTGLGLAITKSLLDEMGGSVEIESKVGVGSTFTIRVRQKDGNENLVDIEDDESVDIKSLKDIKVLVVDDVDMNIVIIDTILTSEQLNVDTAMSGKEAIDKCMNSKYDIILLDHMMPEMDGLETYEVIKKDGLNKETPTIMLTANAMTGAKEEYISHGIKGYVTKPINQNLLNKEILKVLNL